MKALRTAALVLASLVGLALSAPNFYSSNVGKKGIYYSSAAYCKYETLDNWQCGAPCMYNTGLQNVKRIHNPARDSFAFAGWNSKDNEIVLSFRGTNGLDLENWISNIKVLMRVYPNSPITGAEVHTGFFQAYDEIKDKVRLAVNTLFQAHPTATIFVTGHSLGGALATFAALDIKLNINPAAKVTLYTYGQPRCGNEKFSDLLFSKLDGKYIRVTHYDDTVAHIPPLISYFKHAGNEVWYKSKTYDSYFVECSNSAGVTESKLCSNSLWLKTGIDAHTSYFGFEVSGICTQRQPGGTLLKASFDEEVNFENETYLVDTDDSIIKNKLSEAFSNQ
jgi:Lipase (class 3)